MEQSVKKPSFFKMLFSGALSVFSVVFTFAFAVAPGYFGHIYITGGAWRFYAAAVACALVSMYLFGISGVIAQACVIIVAALIYVMMKRRASYFDTALFSAAAITVILYLIISLNDLLTGAPAFQAIQTSFTGMWAETMEVIRSTQSAFTAEQLAAYEQLGYEAGKMLPIYMPAAICSLGAIFGLINVNVAVRLSVKANADMKPMSPFIMWRLPTSFTMGTVVMVAGILISSFIGVTLDAVIPAVTAVILIPLAIQGFCLFRFITLKRKRNGILFGSFVALIILTFPTSLFMLAMLGLSEQFLNIRKKMIESERKN